MIKKHKHRIKTSAKTVRLDPKSRMLIARTIARTLQEMNNRQPEERRDLPQISGFVDHAQIQILLVSSLTDDSLWQVEQMIAEQFRLLVKELVAIKAFQSFTAALDQLNPDLLLVVGNEGTFSGTDLEIIRKSPVKKAIWLSDGPFTSESTARLAVLFDYVFTQNTLHIPFYQHSGCREVHYLPFAADRSLFSPRSVEAECTFDLLLLGDARATGKEYAEIIKHVFPIRKVAAAGTGWEEYPGVKVLPSGAELQNYYNGAEIIIHWGGPPGKIFDIAACGAFQLAEAHPNIYEYMNPGDDIVTFHTAGELLQKLHFYSTHPDTKRAVASRALWRSTYDYSFLQMAAKLLHTVFSR